MTAISISRIVLPLVAVVAAGGVVFAIQYVRREPPADTRAAMTAPAISKPASDAREQSATSLAKAKSEANAVVDALIGSPPSPESGNGVPTFDVASIEPTGEAVIAGRAAPGATVELLRDGEVHDRAWRKSDISSSRTSSSCITPDAASKRGRTVAPSNSA